MAVCVGLIQAGAWLGGGWTGFSIGAALGIANMWGVAEGRRRP
jgi:hypothetical protein